MSTPIAAKLSVLIAIIYLTGVRAMAADGFVMLQSHYDAKETMRRLIAEVKTRGLTVFAHVDHAAGAAAAGLPLRPTDLLIFGNAKGGTPLMQMDQTTGIDLPLKILVWEDPAGSTWLSYVDLAWVAKRHELGPGAESTVNALTNVLQTIANAATGAK